MTLHRNLLCGASIMALAVAQPARAQSTANQPAPPTNYNIDGNGVDVVTGAFYLVTTDLAVGGGDGGMAYTRYSRNLGYDDDYITGITLSQDTTTIIVSLGSISDQFPNGATGSTVTSKIGTGATLTLTAGAYKYVTSSGVIYQFSDALKSQDYRDALQRVSTITYPTGQTKTFDYQTKFYTPCADSCDTLTITRLTGVSSNDGYRLKFNYKATSLPAIGPTDQQIADWMTLAGVTGVNLGVCTQTSCPAGTTWPSVQYSWDATRLKETRTDAMSRTTVIAYDSADRIVGVTTGGASTPQRTLTYDASGRVYKFTLGASTWTYTYSDVGTTRTTTVASPTGLARTVVSNASIFKITSDKTGTAQPVNYEYDSSTRLMRTNYPEGNKTELDYDTRSNVKTVRQLPKSGTGKIETLATFPTDTECATLTAPKCNLPKTTTDARGNITNYEYTDFGAPLKVTAPAPTTGAVRPETRYTYAPRTAWYKNSSGTIVQASAIQKLVAVSQCATGSAPTCVDTADETRSEIDYGTGSATQANNLLPLAITRRSGNTSGAGAVSTTTQMTYTDVGDVSAVNGPLSEDDTTYYRYDANRAVVGVIGPRPVASDTTRRATRITRNTATGLVEKVEQGTTEGIDDPAWAAFVSLQRVETDYDPVTYLKTIDRALAGTTLYQLTQYSYDADLRGKCSATRVALVTATNVCQQNSTTDGYDQVAETVYYTTDGRVQKQRANLTDTASFSYTVNGNVLTATDANGNASTYGYDLYDRRDRLTYPGSTYDGVSYDSAGNVTTETRRNGDTIANVFDNLNRRTSRTPSATSGTATIAYTYDNFGRLTSAQSTGVQPTVWSSQLQYGYDALSRVTSATTSWPAAASAHTSLMEYDAAGRRTKLTWWDGFYVAYDYLTTGEMWKIRENGANSGIGVLATYSYDDLGRRVSLARGNGTTTAWEYDGLSRLKKLTDDLGSAANNQVVDFTYNGVSQLRTRTGNNDLYSYGAYSPSSTAYVPNSLNQFASVGGMSLTWSASGNLAADNRGNSYTYNTDNQMSQKVGVGNFAYDSFGRLSRISPGTGVVRFEYDGDDMILEGANGGNVQRRYVHGPGTDEPLVWYQGAGTGQRRWLSADERGSITAITDDTKALIVINSYDEHGVPASGNQGRFGYTGQVALPEYGLTYYKARMYDPVLGRFMQSDPIGYSGGMNLYAYVKGDPLNLVDPSGTSCVSWWVYTGWEFSDGRIILNQPGTQVEFCTPNLGGGKSGADEFGGGAGADDIIVNGVKPPKNGMSVGQSSVLSQNNQRRLDDCGSEASFGTFRAAANAAFAAYPYRPFYSIFPFSAIRGTRIHSMFAGSLRAMGGMYSSEVSYKDGLVVPYGTLGSVRADGVFGSVRSPSYVVELKSGFAVPTPSEIENYRRNLPPGTGVCAIVEAPGAP